MRPPFCHYALLLLVLGGFVLAGCGRPEPEQQLRDQLKAMQAAAEARNVGDFMDKVTEDFIGNEGMDHASLQQMVRGQVLLNTGVGATLGPVDVTLQGDRAIVKFTVLLTGSNQRVLPERVQTYAITSGWRQEGGEWKVYSAEWKAQL